MRPQQLRKSLLTKGRIICRVHPGVWVFTILIVVLSIAGCGDNSNKAASVRTTASSTDSGPDGSSSAFLAGSKPVAQADAICRRLNAELDSVKYNVQTHRDIAPFARRRALIQKAALTQLGKIRPTPPMASDYQKMLAARRALINDTIKLGQDAAANDKQAESRLLATSGAILREIKKVAVRDDFRYCDEVG